MEEGVLVCSGPGISERRITMSGVSGWLCDTKSNPRKYQLRMKGGEVIDLHDPSGQLQSALSTLSNDFVSLDEIVKSSGPYHEDEHLGRFYYSPGQWRLGATVDLPFQSDIRVNFEQKSDIAIFPESMLKNIAWIQDHLGEIWNAAAGLINEVIELKRIRTPERFAIRYLWVSFPKEALEATEWNFTVEPEDMNDAFEVVFRGLQPVGCRRPYD